MGLEIDAFSSIKYVGLQRVNNVTDYEELRYAITTELKNTAVRSARKPYLVYNMLKNLNDEFSSETESFSSTLFPEQYFVCPVKCLSCGNGCNNGIGHLREGKPHSSNTRLVLLHINFFALFCFNFIIFNSTYYYIMACVAIGASSSVNMKIRYTYVKDVTRTEMRSR